MNAQPQWRDFPLGPGETLTYGLLAKGANGVVARLLDDAGQDGERWSQLMTLSTNFDPEQREDLRESLAATLTHLTEPGRAALRKAMRLFLSHHRRARDADWSLPEEELAQIEVLYQALEPADPVEKVSWIFEEQPSPPDCPADWKEADAHLDRLRVQAASDLLRLGGLSSILTLARNSSQAGFIGKALIDAGMPEEIERELLETGLTSDEDRLAQLAHGILVGRIASIDDTWMRDLVERALGENWGGEAVQRILCALPAERATWDAAREIGSEIEAEYWKRVPPRRIRGTPDDLGYAAEWLTKVGRARGAVDLLGTHLKDQPSERLLRALHEATQERPEASGSDNESTLFSHHVAKILDRLEADPSVDPKDIVLLEWAYFEVLRHSRRPARTLHKALASDPDFFAMLLEAVYSPSNDSLAQDRVADDPEKGQTFARHAWGVLHEWQIVPGADEKGAIDPAALEAWVKAVRLRCAASGRLEVADQQIGDILTAARPDENGMWPPAAVREVIEITRSRDLEAGVLMGVHNRRGVTTRRPDEGGEQERDLATNYRRNAKALALEWPRTSAMLERIAESYDRHAKRHDEWAEQVQWE